MNTDGKHYIRGLTPRRPYPRASTFFVDADVAMDMEEIAINMNTQLGRQLKEREWRYYKFMLSIRSVA